MANTISCPLCFGHEVNIMDKIDGFNVGEFIVALTHIPLSACPSVSREIQSNFPLIERDLMPYFKLSAYLVGESLRFVFEHRGRRSASYLLSADDARNTLDSLKIFFITVFLNELPNHTQGKSDTEINSWKQLLLKVINERFKPFYTAVRNAGAS